MECVNEGWIKFDTEKDENRFIHLVRDIAPSAQPELIRCKDCKYWEYDSIFADGWCRGKHQGNPEWYCADAERREE